ncbi:MAG TPA: helix-turn-helix domain-containing protein [Pseudonocardia sp.]|jgi:excisionase family DNA binding protein
MSLSEQRTNSGHTGKTDRPSPASGNELLTVAEVSSTLRVSKMTIYRMVHSGTIAHVRVGRSFRIPADAVHEILNQRGMQSSA